MKGLVLTFFLTSVNSFTSTSMKSSSINILASTEASIDVFYEPSARDSIYNGKTAQYLVDMHDNKATFDFCGGLMFQLELSEALRNHLVETKNVQVSDSPRMRGLSGYKQESAADNVQIFHGREIRNVVDAAGGMGLVLQLSLANGSDPEGWNTQEIETYNGWAHDASRTWRKGADYEREGFVDFRKKYGPESYGLHHRFFWHTDNDNRIWLSAEDGCEGTPAASALRRKPFLGLF